MPTDVVIDPKMVGSPILCRTGCRVGSHVFTWGGVGASDAPLAACRCDCTLYTWEEWQKGTGAR